MGLPSADDLRAIFAAARENGVTHLRVGGVEAWLSLAPAAQPAPAQTVGAAMVAALNAEHPLPGADPIETVKGSVLETQRRVMRDPLDILASGGRLMDSGSPDPTQAS